MRLDQLLAHHFQEQSRTYFQYLIEEGFVLLNGGSVKKRVKPQLGDEIEVHFALTPEISLAPEPIPLDVLYEDEWLIAVNKPAGMVVHPAPGHWSGTFVNALLHHCQNKSLGGAPLRPGIVHRLDKETSGILIAAKDESTHQKLVALFAGRSIHKEYLAICIGNPGKKLIQAPIGRHPVLRKCMAVVSEGGKEAMTSCHPLAFDGKLSLVRIHLLTGRTHQIRVHLKHNGTPILGDPLYGNAQWNQKWDLERQMLHAALISFVHPITNKKLEISAPIPEDMRRVIDKHFPRSEEPLCGC